MTDTYNKALDLINKFVEFKNNGAYKDLTSQKHIPLALAMLQDISGILKIDGRITNLCANCFMLGVYLTKHSGGQETSEQEQAKRCLQCDFVTSKSGVFKCRLERCKYD